ncbi:MAG: RNA polymerase sigma factor [Clostridia bacterium]|nr:RNA polymerase sigma factor [Clostridia bacterium]
MQEPWDFDAFLTGTAPALTGYCAAIAGCADGEDAAQEALVRLWQNRAQIPNEKAAAVFVYRTAYRLCVDALRRRKRQQTAEARMQEEYQNDRLTDRLSDRMLLALRTLSPADRAIVYSRVLEEVPYGQIAERFGKTEAWARKRYSLARLKLEKILTKEEEHG